MAQSAPKPKKNNRVGIAGEYFVAAELNRRGATAVTLTTNMPEVDVVATDPSRSRTIYIQVKTKMTGRTKRTGKPTGNWHSRTWEGNKSPKPEHFWAFVSIPQSRQEPPSYWIVSDDWMREDIKNNHAAWLLHTGGRRPRGSNSDHHGISEGRLKGWEDSWDILDIC